MIREHREQRALELCENTVVGGGSVVLAGFTPSAGLGFKDRLLFRLRGRADFGDTKVETSEWDTRFGGSGRIMLRSLVRFVDEPDRNEVDTGVVFDPALDADTLRVLGRFARLVGTLVVVSGPRTWTRQ